MKISKIPIDAFKRGLVPKENTRNVLYLTESQGLIPYEGALITVDDLESSRIDLDALGCSFPYPQFMVLKDIMIICTQTKIYEYDGSTTTLKLGSITPGVLWTAADYKAFVLFTNGQVMVKRDANGTYSLDTDRPFGSSICKVNARMFLTAPNVALSGNI